MAKTATFGNAALAKKMIAQFGTTTERFNVEMQHTSQVKKFIQKIEEAHEQAAKSKLIFG